MGRPLVSWNPSTSALVALGTMSGHRSLTQGYGRLPLPAGLAQPFGLWARPTLRPWRVVPPHSSSWTLRTPASSVRTPSLAWCTAMSCPWTQPSWTCWWPWPRATIGARSATRSWWTWSVPQWVGSRGGVPGLGQYSALARVGWAGSPSSLPFSSVFSTIGGTSNFCI